MRDNSAFSHEKLDAHKGGSFGLKNPRINLINFVLIICDLSTINTKLIKPSEYIL